MTDSDFVDMAPFFAHLEHKTRRLLIAVLCVCLLLSAVIAARMLTTERLGQRGLGFVWGMGVVYAPAVTLFWWTFTEFMARRRRGASPPGDRLPTGPDDALNGSRIAQAGFIFTIGLLAAGLTTQLLVGLVAFRIDLGSSFGTMVSQALCFGVGAVTIYLGNLWPRMPTPRAPGQQAAKIMKVNRYVGWFMVVVGLLVFLLGLFLPHIVAPARPTQPPFVASKHREISLPAAALDRFVGRYDFGDNFVVSVTHDGPTLWVLRERSPGARAAPIYPEAPSTFFWKAVEAQIRFTVDAGGAVIGAEFREGGAWQPGKRLGP